jgi:hypothetical protein
MCVRPSGGGDREVRGESDELFVFRATVFDTISDIASFESTKGKSKDQPSE